MQLPSIMGVLGGYPGLSSGASPRAQGTHSNACRRASGLPWTRHAAGPPSPRCSCCGGNRGIRESPTSCPQTQISSPGPAFQGWQGSPTARPPFPALKARGLSAGLLCPLPPPGLGHLILIARKTVPTILTWGAGRGVGMWTWP